MDAVKAFNTEMASMLDMKPPISRAKMLSVTKAGMKAIKLYKHVVQIIEKFIKKCNPELKVPGLYVVDSIIRQSRHQFGEDKDVFGPRFLKNINATFQSLYECPPDDKDKILRVLSLWQKNSVFGMDVIQPLADMSSSPAAPVLENGGVLRGSPAGAECVQHIPEPPTTPVPQNPADQQNDVTLAAVTQFLQSTQGLDLQQILRTLQQGGATQASTPNTTSMGNLANATSAQQNNSISKVTSTQVIMNVPHSQRTHQGRFLSQFSNQLDKKTQQQDVSSLMEEFGQIESINMIRPRGCAYIIMVHRQDAYTALSKLSRGNVKINHKSFKIAWAMNKGVTGRFKKYWNMELGVTYVPWEKLKDTEISALREGAVLDQETLKPEWASMLGEFAKPAEEGPEKEREGGASVASQVPAVSTESGVQQPNILPVEPVDPPSENPIDAPRSYMEPFPLTRPPLHQCLLLFPNVLRPPNLLPNIPRAPMYRIRLPVPTEDFPHPGLMEAEHWNGRNFGNDRQENGPPRGPPERFSPEPLFRPSRWNRGGHWGQGQFRN
ncbi:splicing factor, arginine/serine-rich 15 isoform X1 [Silurus asotus]|uniref:Splicing factor, arginine/serine-rich 15 isoform X1 n=1 Tax=Silurus asotus TaxID=30991 RepID=A0AAD5AYM6_SILAS|nr:splicing factor, arginine/serine-rich 15 isoform X1 [Silurus asotus]